MIIGIIDPITVAYIYCQQNILSIHSLIIANILVIINANIVDIAKCILSIAKIINIVDDMESPPRKWRTLSIPYFTIILSINFIWNVVYVFHRIFCKFNTFFWEIIKMN